MRKLTLPIIILLVIAPLFAFYGTAGAQDDAFSLCQVTDVGGIDDRSFNATAWEGALRVEEELGGSVQFLESQEQTDYEPNINAFVEDECDLILAVGFLMGEATAIGAEANPDFNFAIIDFAYDPPIDNVLGLVYNTDEAAFLAGYIAAATSETGIVGTFGGINIPPVTVFMDGFALGVQYYNEQNDADVEVLGWDVEEQDGLFTGNFESTDDGRALGEALMDEGADVILPVAGPVGLGTAAAVQERGDAWVVWVDTDGTVSAPDFADIILTSIMKRMDNSVFSVAELTMAGDFAGGVFVNTLENEGVGLGTTNEIVPEELLEEIDEIRELIIAGELATSPPMMMEEDAEAEEGGD